MKNKLLLFVILIVNIVICQPAFSETNSDFPTHCKPGEFVFLNAKMASYEVSQQGYFLNNKNGKILSLCADKQNEPFGKFVYRYGVIGKVEMEKVATSTDKFIIYTRSTSPHTGEDIISFINGEYTYYITEATGQGHGISLLVYKSGKHLVNLFSGLDYGSDYESGFININFDKASSPVFKIKEPLDF